jgi:hypothetical protein
MKKQCTVFLVLGSVLTFAACVAETRSSLMGDDIDIHPDVVQPAAAMTITCPATALVFLLASSERMSRIASWDLMQPDRDEADEAEQKGARNFATAIAKARTDLEQALARDPGCRGENDSGARTKLMFVSIIDGNGTSDSRISSSFFGYEGTTWRRMGTRNWKYTRNRLTPLGKPATGTEGLPVQETFELDMSGDATKIAAIFASNGFESINSNEELTSGTYRPDQITYIIKAHGARILTSNRYKPTLTSLTEYFGNGVTAQEWEPAIFLDTNGPAGTLSGPAFSAHWDKDQFGDLTAGDGDQTSGDGSPSDSTSGDFDQTSGDGFETSGKGLAFSDAVLDHDAQTEYRGSKRYGVYGTYLTPHTNIGARRIRFPVAARKVTAGWSGLAPMPKNLIILDACYGSDKILSALQYNGTGAGNTVVLASASPLYYHFLDYSALGFSGLLKFPALLERLKKGENLTTAEAKLAENMTNGTLANNSVQQNRENKKLTIWAD